MAIRIQIEMRKINGLRFARLKLAEEVETDSREEAQLHSAMRECNLDPGNNVGVFRTLARSADGASISRVAGVDIPLAAIQDFTAALTRRGFEVS